MDIGACPHFPMPRQAPLDPPEAYLRFQLEAPAIRAHLWNGQTTWLVTRYDDVRMVLGDSERFSTVPSTPGYPMMAPGRAEILLNEHPTLQRMDPPEHGPYRRMLTRDFAVKRIEAMRGQIERIVDELLDGMEKAGLPCDLVKALALPLPTMVISDMLGVPYADHDFVQEKSAAKLKLEGDPKAPLAAQQAIIAYFDSLLRTMEAAPPAEKNTILARLVVDEILPGNLSHDDAVAIAELLVVAGHETSANMVALGTLVLLQHPEQAQLLRDDPARIPKAIDEMLRFLTVTHFNGARVAKQNVEIGGVQIKAGEGVWALINAANRDEKAFPFPDRFDVTREAAHHVTFGFGVHQCLGQGLARLELSIVFEKLLKRFPTLRLAVPATELQFKHESFIFGVRSLPVAWQD